MAPTKRQAVDWTSVPSRSISISGDAYRFARKRAFGVFLGLPGVRDKVRKQVDEATLGLEKKLVNFGPDVTRHSRLPAEGWSAEVVKKELEDLSNMKHTRWEDGYVSGAVYHGGQDLQDVQIEAFSKFTVSNPIHPDVFPAVRKMEAEVVAMVLSMFHAPEGAAGVTTSGGTESILMACLSARQKAYHERNVTEPEMILPETAHVAFRKACDYFGIKMHLVECAAPGYKVSVGAVGRLINANTILLVGSAPNFPHGIIDDISALSRLALRKRLPLHVDCCLGSFLVPFLARAGYPTESFDFRLRGVTSISVDTHKYGFAPKGSSTVLYRDQKLRSYQYYVSPDWSGGVYASPNMAGSRPGALIAGCWASMMKQGENGYIKSCHAIVGAAKKIEGAIRTDPALSADLTIIGKPLVSVIAFKSNTLNMYDIADGMSAKGWHLNALQNPPAMHVAVTLPIVPVADKLVRDLIECVAEEKAKEAERVASGKGKKGSASGDTAALYGVAGSLPDKRIVVSLANAFLDTLYKVDGEGTVIYLSISVGCTCGSRRSFASSAWSGSCSESGHRSLETSCKLELAELKSNWAHMSCLAIDRGCRTSCAEVLAISRRKSGEAVEQGVCGGRQRRASRLPTAEVGGNRQERTRAEKGKRSSTSKLQCRNMRFQPPRRLLLSSNLLSTPSAQAQTPTSTSTTMSGAMRATRVLQTMQPAGRLAMKPTSMMAMRPTSMLAMRRTPAMLLQSTRRSMMPVPVRACSCLRARLFR
ncbi:hypothetical protein FH972_023303 [Carpinus fangiana]|uniref:sphinganine-1-phosphate aldolase n=1 Tax=Carpinus fangiana TaxID=176857 RepID=A0A5N6KVF6_9ROSI|nr:hypothetical protein FH972_023303 [Carpinus fangiana]